MQIGLGISLRSPTNLSIGQKAVSILKRYGADAHVYLPGIGTLSGLAAGNYTLSDGSTGVAAVDGPDGLVLDAAGVSTALPTSSTAGWATTNCTIASDGNAITQTVTTAVSPYMSRSFPTSVGQTYALLVTLTRGTTPNSNQVLIGTFAGGGGILQDSTLSTSVSKVYTFTATTTATFLSVGLGETAIGQTSIWSAISWQTGIHATQSTSGFRPRLERGARNLFKQSGDISNAAHATALVTGATAIDFQTVSCTAANNSGFRPEINSATDTFVAPAVGTYTFSFEVAAGTISNLFIGLDAGNCTLTSDAPSAVVPLTTEFVKKKITVNITVAGTVFRIQLFNQTLSAGTFKVRNFQYETGPTASDYSPTTTAAASNPNAGRYSWAFDGVDDRLQLASVPFQMADDHAVIVAFRADANTKFAFGCGNGTTQIGNIGINSSGYVFAEWKDDASTTQTLQYAVVKAGVPVVVSCRKVGNVKVLRVDGVERATGSTVMGATAATLASIGAQAGGWSLQFNGAIGWCLPLKGTFTDADMLTLERQVASQFPNGTVF